MTPPLAAFFVVILIGFLASGGLSAAPIRFLAWDDGVAARKIGFQNTKGVEELQDLHPGKRSAPVDGTAGESPLQLVALDRPGDDGKSPGVEIKIGERVQAPLVLILPDPKNPAGFRPFVIDDNAANFKWGTLRFVNATGKALLVRQDDKIKPLPDSWSPVDIAPGGEGRNMGIQVVAREDVETLLYSAVWEHHPDIRKLIFVVPGSDVRTGVIEFKIIPEDRRVIEAEAAAESDKQP